MLNMKEEIINAMQETIHDITSLNVTYQKSKMVRLFNLYEEVDTLFPDIMKTIESSSSTSESVEHVDTVLSSLDHENKIIIGPFVRELIGGRITVNKVIIRLNEKSIREHGINHGDILSVDYSNDNNKIIERLKLSKTKDECTRGEIRLGVVSDSYLDGELVVKEYIGDGVRKPILLDGETPFIFRITDYEKQKFQLLPGDFVDVAYFKEYHGTYKLAWKYLNSEVFK